MNIDPNYAICVYRDNPKQIIDYIADSLGFDVCIDDGIRMIGPGNFRTHVSISVLNSNSIPIFELSYCGWGAYKNCFYLWTNSASRLMEDQYCVNYTPVSNIINRIKQTYIDYRQKQKIDHQQDIKQAGLVYDV